MTPWLFIPSENTVLFVPCLLSHGVIPLLPIRPPLPPPAERRGARPRIARSWLKVVHRCWVIPHGQDLPWGAEGGRTVSLLHCRLRPSVRIKQVPLQKPGQVQQDTTAVSLAPSLFLLSFIPGV